MNDIFSITTIVKIVVLTTVCIFMLFPNADKPIKIIVSLIISFFVIGLSAIATTVFTRISITDILFLGAISIFIIKDMRALKELNKKSDEKNDLE